MCRAEGAVPADAEQPAAAKASATSPTPIALPVTPVSMAVRIQRMVGAAQGRVRTRRSRNSAQASVQDGRWSSPMDRLIPTIVHVPATTLHGVGDLVLGVALIMFAVFLYRAAPSLEEAVRRAWFPNREVEGRRIRTVGEPVVIAGFGGLCLLAGMLHLV